MRSITDTTGAMQNLPDVNMSNCELAYELPGVSVGKCL